VEKSKGGAGERRVTVACFERKGGTEENGMDGINAYASLAESISLSQSHGKLEGFLLMEVKTSFGKASNCSPPENPDPDSEMWNETQSSDLQIQTWANGRGWLMTTTLGHMAADR